MPIVFQVFEDEEIFPIKKKVFNSLLKIFYYLFKEDAVKFYKIAIEKGNKYAMYNYAYMLANGDGIEQNKEEIIKYYIMAAEK